MEYFLSLFVHYDTIVVSMLVVGITVIVVMLLLFNQRNPESIVRSEMGGSDNIEGALRRVLGERQWATATGEDGEVSGNAEDLEKEILEKDRTIAELNKQITAGGGSAGAGASGDQGDNSELLERIQELEGRLEEYEIIEDDIADLSLFKTENEKLKKELAKLKGQAGLTTSEDTASSASGEDAAPGETPDPGTTFVQDHSEKDDGPDAADLVAEFEKVVNNQAQMDTEPMSAKVEAEESAVAPEPAAEVTSEQDAATVAEPGDTVVANNEKIAAKGNTETAEASDQTIEVKGGDSATSSDNEKIEVKEKKSDDSAKEDKFVISADKSNIEPLKLHSKLDSVSPDSKEEAEVFIDELKTLKKQNQGA